MPGRDPYDYHFVRDCPKATWTAYAGETPMTAILAGVFPRTTLEPCCMCLGGTPVTIIIMCMALVDKGEEGRIYHIYIKGSK